MNKGFALIALSGAVLLLASGCVSLKVGTETEPSRVQLEGLGTAYGAISGIRPYDKTILKFSILNDSEDSGEIASLDIWPLMALRVGLVGVKARILPVEFGAGVLFYRPEPSDFIEAAEEDEAAEHDEAGEEAHPE